MGGPKRRKVPTPPPEFTGEPTNIFLTHILFLSYVFVKLNKSWQKKPDF